MFQDPDEERKLVDEYDSRQRRKNASAEASFTE